MVSFMLGPLCTWVPLGQGVVWASEAAWTWWRTAKSASAENLTHVVPFMVSRFSSGRLKHHSHLLSNVVSIYMQNIKSIHF
jgi:hypothetical protein